MKVPQKSYTLDEARSKLENYCAYQERCHQEVRETLRKMRMIPEAADQIIVHLIENDFLNEERFARKYCSGKFHIKNWGRNRLRRELKQRNISKYNIDKGLGEIDDETYLQAFDELAMRKWELLSKEKNLLKRKKKLADYLFYRGWESDLVYPKLSELK